MADDHAAAHTVVCGWLDDPRTDRGVRFLGDDGQWQRLTYAELADLSLRAGAALADSGVRRGDVVPLALPNGIDLVSHLLGLWAIGATPSVLALPWALRAGRSYQRQVQAVARRLRPRHVVVAAGFAEVFAESIGEHAASVTVLSPRYAPDGADAPRARTDLAVLQFTSGSRGDPRGLRISVENLAANLRMIHDWTRVTHHGAVSWLPLYHDMGLIGGLLAGVSAQTEHALVRPEHFLQDVIGWLAEYGRSAYAHMVMPNFGFEFVLGHVQPSDLAGMDFSTLETVVSGAERIDPAVLARFAALLAPFGFDRRALMPAYGLAEGTLAVTGMPRESMARMVRVASLHRRLGSKVEVCEVAELTERPVDQPWLWQVSCGPAMPGLQLRILDEDGAVQPEGVLGEVHVSGSSVAQGYLEPSPEDAERLRDGRLFTGDAGFVLDGELFVVGRMGDSFTVNGQNVFVEDIEAELAASGLVGRHDSTVVAGMHDGRPTVLLVTERPLPEGIGARAEGVIRSLAGDRAAVRSIVVGRGNIPMTSSRKPRRRSLWLTFASGGFDEPGAGDTAAREGTSHG